VHGLHDVVLHLSGELDLGGIEALESCVERALEDRPRRLVLELSALTFLDVAGSQCCDETRRRAEASGVELILDSPSAFVFRVLGLCGAAEHFRLR
jgi:anti-sigma B factor antagonist